MHEILQKLKLYAADNLYRFIVDGVFHKKEAGWYGYAKREPGCLPGAFNALAYALTEHLEDGNVSINLIKNIHERAMRPIRDNVLRPGSFRIRHTFFPLCPKEIRKYGFCNEKGMDELIQFVREHQEYQAAIFIPEYTLDDINHKIKTGHYRNNAEARIAYDEAWNMFRIVPDNSSAFSYDEFKKEQFQPDHHKPIQWFILSPPSWFFRAPNYEHLPLLVDTACRNYNESIQNDHSDEEKLKIIVTFIQTLERIHPFGDGNGRTSYILLQRLLIQNGFLPTIMENPNHLDGFDQASVIAEIRQGMEYTQSLIDNPQQKVFDYETKFLKVVQSTPAAIASLIQQYYAAEDMLYQCIQSIPAPPPKKLIIELSLFAPRDAGELQEHDVQSPCESDTEPKIK